MITKVMGTKKEVILFPGGNTVIIGDRINPVINSRVQNALQAANMQTLVDEARSQFTAGADMILINVCGNGINEEKLLPESILAVTAEIGAPVVVDTKNPTALKTALDVCPGKPVVASINGTDHSLNELLPLAMDRKAAILVSGLNDRGAPDAVEERIELGRNTLRQVLSQGMPREDIILAVPAGSIKNNPKEALAVITTLSKLSRIEMINCCVSIGELSSGLQESVDLDHAFIALCISSGANCLVADPKQYADCIKATDVLLCRNSLA